MRDSSRSAAAALVRKQEQLKYGVYYDDEYDYLQHLRPSGGPDAAVAYADEKELARLRKNPDRETLTKRPQGLDLPPELFASAREEDVGLLNRAAPVTGLRLDMDPDIVRNRGRHTRPCARARPPLHPGGRGGGGRERERERGKSHLLPVPGCLLLCHLQLDTPWAYVWLSHD